MASDLMGQGSSTTRRWRWLALLAAVGCSTANYTRSAYGTVGGYSLANARPKPPSLMVARKIERPLYLVLDPSRVKNTWQLETAACAARGYGCERFELLEAQLFVERDLKGALENYFSRVEVVHSPTELPATPHVVADVKVDDLRLNALVRGALTYELIEMNWGIGLRPSEEADYAFSFAGVAQSNDSYPTFEAGCATLVENALSAFLKKWVEGHGVEDLQKLNARPGGKGPVKSL